MKDLEMGYIQDINGENINIQVPVVIEESFLSKTKLEFLNGFHVDIVKRVFLNFSAVQQINSVGLSVLFSMRLFFKSLGIEVIAVNVNESITNFFKAVGLEQILENNVKTDVVSSFAKNESTEHEINVLKTELSYQKELYARVTKELEEKLSKLSSDLKQKNEQLQLLDKANSIGELAAGVAHEFNNIIGGILGYAQLAQAKNSPELTEKALTNIITLSKRSEGITNGLLNFSRKKPVKVTHVNLRNLIQSVLNFTQKQLENLKIVVHTDYQNIDMVYADENLVSQVVLNLVINASHAMENGGELFISLYKQGSFIKIKIKDTGVGIKRSNITRIFQPFFTTKGALGGGNKSGTGLGLSVSKSIVEMHEGKLEVESEEGKGATFTICLPEKIISKDYKVYVETPDDIDVKQASKSKILVVDDEEMIRSIISVSLSDLGHDILEAGNGEDGVKLYLSHKPDLVFLDILMPRMNGMDAYLEIKKVNPNAKIVFITGQAGEYLEKLLENLTKTENIYLLRKPFEIDELIRVVNVVLSYKT